MTDFHKEEKFWFIAITALVAIALYFFWDSSFLVRSVAAVCFLFIFYAGDKIYRIGFTNKHYILFIILIVATVLASQIYFIWPQYDKLQHFAMPILISAMVFFMVNKLKLEMKWKIWYTFFIAVAILGLFELIEYSIDQFFDFKLQGVFARDPSGLNKYHTLLQPLDDTMIDMFFGVLGTTLYCIYLGLKFQNKN